MGCCPRCQPPEWFVTAAIVFLSVVMGLALYFFVFRIL